MLFPRVILATLTFFGWALAQSPTLQTYSYTEDPAIPIMGPAVTKVFRDGSKEVIEQVMPAGFLGREKEYRGHLLYDFQAHKLYTQVLSDPGSPCGLQDLAESAAPGMLDPVGNSDFLKELTTGAQLKETGSETVNGIPAKVMQFTSAQGKGKVWLAQNGGYLVKIESTAPDGKVTPMLEIKQFSVVKPPAAIFTPPAGCVAAQTTEVKKASTNVTAVTLQPIGNYNGPCPAKIKMAGTITVDGPGKVFYQFGAGTMEPGETVTFTAAGTKTVSHVMTLKPAFGNNMGGGAILEAVGMDEDGGHSPSMTGSNNSDFNITCTSGGGK